MNQYNKNRCISYIPKSPSNHTNCNQPVDHSLNLRHQINDPARGPTFGRTAPTPSFPSARNILHRSAVESRQNVSIAKEGGKITV